MLGLVLLVLVVAAFAPHLLSMTLCVLAVLIIAAAAAGALKVYERRARAAEAARAQIEAELAAFQTVMGDLPELALAMDLEGRAQAVFGRPIAGFDADRLHEGLLHAVSDIDRPQVQAALQEAGAGVTAKAIFLPAEPGAPRLHAVIQRTGKGLIAILREPPPATQRDLAPPAAPSSGPDMADLTLRLRAAEAARADAEADRRKAEADAAGRARFLANMSHELRTPLNAIMGFSDIMRTRLFGDLSVRYTEYAELIHEAGRHLLDLINDVLDMSKIEAQRYELSREIFDAREAVNAALRLVRLQADDAGVKLRGVLPTAPLEIDADRRAIKQIVLNLVSNALKFTPAGGAVTVSVDKAGADFELLVADTGVGIAAEDLDRLGRPYQQAGGADERAQGTGLGLSLVRAFAELHGGRMSLESRLGEGTAVTVRLPVLVGAESPRAQPISPEPFTVEAPEAATPPAPAGSTVAIEPPTPSAEPPMPRVAPGGVPDAPET